MKYTVLLLALMLAGCGESSTNEGESAEDIDNKEDITEDELESVEDIDGNRYEIVKIGSQYWFKSNLKVSRYRNGDKIPTRLSSSEWEDVNYTMISDAYAIYEYEQKNDDLYGKLYNHYAVTDRRGLCPTGWHVPSDTEWTTLENQLGGSSVAGAALKSTSTQPTPGGWDSPNEGATNSSGFAALPGGCRELTGYFSDVTSRGAWWSSSSAETMNDAWHRTLFYEGSLIYRGPRNRANGFSVRCLED